MMNSDAKTALSNTIGKLRTRLLEDLDRAVESRYRMGIARVESAGLAPHIAADRRQLAVWWDEQVRADATSGGKRTAAQFRAELQAEAAYTWLHRLVVLRLMEEAGIVKPALIKNGWDSSAYREFRDWSPELLSDESQGFERLLRIVFDELAIDLPGLFGRGIIDLVPMPPATLRAMIDALNDTALASCWSDDTTLGWVYQYWNDPARKLLDDKITAGGKVEPHEIASKTQLFTERYMVEWLLQNSLGTMWLAMCKKQGWVPDVEANGTLAALEARREEWRTKRESGEVKLDELMPIHSQLEEHWKFWVPQSIPDAAIKSAPNSIGELKLLDPAVGSGHFLVIAFDYLYPLYEEEARHRGESRAPHEIVTSIIENNLHGIDIDARCIQIAAAALYLKARSKHKGYRPRVMNLVAPNLPLARLPDDDPALVEFRKAVVEETGIDAAFLDSIFNALKEAYHLGSLLKVEEVIGDAMRDYQTRALDSERSALSASEARNVLLEKLETFLDHHTGREDLGLALHGAQLAAGIRFVRMVLDANFDVVVANPPYSGTSKLKNSKYVEQCYKRGKADLYAAFLERGLQLVRKGGVSAMVTMRGWMFIKQFEKLRQHLAKAYDIRSIGDLDTGAFEEIGGHVVSSVLTCIWNEMTSNAENVAIKATEGYGAANKRAALLAQVGRYEFSVDALKGIEGQPLIYWWDDAFLREYVKTAKLEDVSPARQGMATANNTRFLRAPWEVRHSEIFQSHAWSAIAVPDWSVRWVPYVKGAAGAVWFEPLRHVLRWHYHGLELRNFNQGVIRNEDYYFRPGVAFASTGAAFTARLHRFRSVFDTKGQSVFPTDLDRVLCAMNSQKGRSVLTALNPTISFQVGDANRLPLFDFTQANEVGRVVRDQSGVHEEAREGSLEFRAPRPTAWRAASAWAEATVFTLGERPWDDFVPTWDQPSSSQYFSFAVGVGLGRFGRKGEGWLAEAPPDALPHGILYVSNTDNSDSLDHPACDFLRETWAEHGAEISKNHDLNTWLREKWFNDVHLDMYEKRPIYFPLSSANENFVAHVSIHRWTIDTLRDLLAHYLNPEKAYLEGVRDDVVRARASDDSKARAAAEDRYAQITALLSELEEFIRNVQQCAEKGPPPTDKNPKKCPPREVDHRYDPDLDDGVMINSAALWPLLEPQWKDPKTWWNQLSTEKGYRGKHFDWAHLAKKYWPTRVEDKCKKDPSLAVAHGCFWKYHPERAYEWELRLQHEIAPDFTIDEDESDTCRAKFLAENPKRALEIRDAELKRRKNAEAKDSNGEQLDLGSQESHEEEDE